MALEWKFQQENARLQTRIKRMEKVVMEYGIPEDDDENEKAFTKAQSDFIYALGLNYGKAYRLARKFGSGHDAIEEIMEAEGYEFEKVI